MTVMIMIAMESVTYISLPFFFFFKQKGGLQKNYTMVLSYQVLV